MTDRNALANALMGRSLPEPQRNALMPQEPPSYRQQIANALMGAADYAGRGLATADLYSGGMLSSLAGLNPFTSYGSVMEARDRALQGVPNDIKAMATEPINPVAAMLVIPPNKIVRAYRGVSKANDADPWSWRPSAAEQAVFLSDDPREAYQFALRSANYAKPDAKVLRADVDVNDFRMFNANDELYEPEMMLNYLYKTQQSGAPGAIIRNIQNFEYGDPTTSIAVLDRSRINPVGR